MIWAEAGMEKIFTTWRYLPKIDVRTLASKATKKKKTLVNKWDAAERTL